MTSGVIGRVVLGVWLGCCTVAAAQLPPEIMADRHMIRLDRLISENRHQEAYQLTGEIEDFYEKHNLELAHEFYFKQAKITRSLGLLKETIVSLQAYLNKAGKEGTRYIDALKLLDRTEEELRKAEAKRKRIEAERRRVEALRRENSDQAKRQIEAASVPLARDPLSSGGFAPGMVIIATGRFKYFRSQVEFDKPFAISKYEVTRGQFEQFVKSSRYRTEAERGLKLGCAAGTMRVTSRRKRPLKWDRPGFGQTNTHPVTCVSIRDAMAYARWLSQQTGNSYRLPSFAEWQYAARAGSQWSMRDLGPSLHSDDWKAKGWTKHCGRANLHENDYQKHMLCLDGVEETAPVGSYPPNGIGLHDMIGNVGELVLSCLASGYPDRKPPGSVENPNDCEKHVGVLGGSWESRAHASYRTVYWLWVNEEDGSGIHRNSVASVGFRVVKDF